MSVYEFKMPKLGESITEAAIITWFKGVGDTVEADEMLLEVATDKVDSEVPSPVSGKVTEILYQPNEVIQIGEVIARIQAVTAQPNTKSNTKPASVKSRTSETAKTVKAKPSRVTKSVQPGTNDRFYSPLILEIARTHHISFDELSRIPASGKGGRLRKSDIMTYIEEGRPFKFSEASHASGNFVPLPPLEFDKGEGRREKMDRMRQLIAEHMSYSKLTSPHVTAYSEADLTDLVSWREAHKTLYMEKHGVKLTFTPLFIQAVVRAIQDFPMINTSLDGDTIIVKDTIHIGMATALPSGNLIVPVVKQADTKSLEELAVEVNDLAERARSNALKPDEIKGSTFTISNVGTFGSLMGTPIINQPEAAILAFGRIKKRPEVIETPEGDEIAIRHMMFLSLSFDHRIIDGHLGGSFLQRVVHYLEGDYSN